MVSAGGVASTPPAAAMRKPRDGPPVGTASPAKPLTAPLNATSVTPSAGNVLLPVMNAVGSPPPKPSMPDHAAEIVEHDVRDRIVVRVRLEGIAGDLRRDGRASAAAVGGLHVQCGVDRSRLRDVRVHRVVEHVDVQDAGAVGFKRNANATDVGVAGLACGLAAAEQHVEWSPRRDAMNAAPPPKLLPSIDGVDAGRRTEGLVGRVGQPSGRRRSAPPSSCCP